MKTKTSIHRFLVVLAATAGFTLGSPLRAQTIIFDGFSTNADASPATAGSTLDGRTPDSVNAPSGIYTATSQNTGGQYAQPALTGINGTPASAASTGFNGTASISIASNATFTKPVTLTLSLNVQINNLQDDYAADPANLTNARGISLGFFSAVPANGQESNVGFYGLNVAPDGTLYLVENGLRTGVSAAPSIDFSPSNFYQLTYTVDTSTGLLTDVTFGGNDESAAFAGMATGMVGPVTDQVGFYGSTANDATLNGYVTDFGVAAVPEPSTWSLVGLGATGACVVAMRRRRTA